MKPEQAERHAKWQALVNQQKQSDLMQYSNRNSFFYVPKVPVEIIEDYLSPEVTFLNNLRYN
jgi:hypothetical protein